MTSIYHRYFEAIEGVTDKVECTVDANGKKCGISLNSMKASNLQEHLKDVHTEFYATIQLSPKSNRPSNQMSLTNFVVATPGKSSGRCTFYKCTT
jgi:hypothetical protein